MYLDKAVFQRKDVGTDKRRVVGGQSLGCIENVLLELFIIQVADRQAMVAINLQTEYDWHNGVVRFTVI